MLVTVDALTLGALIGVAVLAVLVAVGLTAFVAGYLVGRRRRGDA